MVRRAVALFILVAACRNQVALHRPGEDWLDKIEITGNKGIETDDLRDGLALKRVQDEGGAIDPYQLNVDTDRIHTAYLKLGYFDVDVKPRVDLKDHAQTVVFAITEGKRATTKVVIAGLPPEVSPEKARKLVDIKEGAPFDYEVYDDAKEPLIALLENAGYAHAALDAQVLADHVHAEATIQLLVDPGQRCTFGRVEVDGLTGELEEAVRARLHFEPGGVYSAEALQKTQQALYEMARFSTVRIEPDKSGDTVIPVKIVLVRGSRYELKLGGGLAYEPLTDDVRVRGAFGIVDPWPLFNFSIEGQLAITFPRTGILVPDFGEPEPKGHLTATLSRLDLFDTGVRGELQASFDYLTVEAYTNYGPRFQLGVSSKLGFRWLQGRIGWLFADYSFRDFQVDDATQTLLRLDPAHPNERLGVIQESIVADLRDDPIAATKGFYIELRAGEGTKYAGGSGTYFRIVPELRGYYPVLGNVLAARLRFGGIFGDVPATERFYSGGASSQRGFSERHLSPAVVGINSMMGSLVPIGGGGVIETGIEVRRFFGKWIGLHWGGVAFLDGGDVTETPGDLDPLHLHWAAGAGLRVEIIKSLSVRLDLGVRLNRYGPTEPEPDSRWALHLGVGEAY